MADQTQTTVTRHPMDRGLVGNTGGAVYVEFLLAFLPLFVMFLGMLQLALLYTGNLVVRHAAHQAARAAIVVLPDDPEHYGGEAVNQLTDSVSSVTDPSTAFLEGVGLPGGAAPAIDTALGTGGARLQAIRAAASIPLMAISPSMEQLIEDPTVYRAVGGAPESRAATGAALYNRTAMAVTFPKEPGGDSFRTSFGEDDDITVRVTYLFHCGVPLAARLICNTYLELNQNVSIDAANDLADALATSPIDMEAVNHALGRLRNTQERLGAAQPGMAELDQAESPWLAAVTSLTGAEFHVLRAEVTLPNQGAGYTFPGGGGAVSMRGP